MAPKAPKAKAAPKLPKGCTLDIQMKFPVEDLISSLDEALDGAYEEAPIIAEKIIDAMLPYIGDDEDARARFVAKLNEGGGDEYVKKVGPEPDGKK
jgi:hypothetical protein